MTYRIPIALMASLTVACGGGEPDDTPDETPSAEAPAPAPAGPTMGEMTMPDWYHVDEAARTVHMTITAGATDAKAYWNYNGGYDGNMRITVPEGYEVTIDFVNDDPAMTHSLGIEAQTSNFSAAPQPNPVFEGALTSDPTNMGGATMPGDSETITFTASTAGEYAMVCYIPGHAATGMWIYFDVSADGEAGVQTAM